MILDVLTNLILSGGKSQVSHNIPKSGDSDAISIIASAAAGVIRGCGGGSGGGRV